MYFAKECPELSNFYLCKIPFLGLTFPSVENAFQAAKCPMRASEFVNLTPSEAKHLGRRVQLRSDWEDVKVIIMKNLLASKFQNPKFKTVLRSIQTDIVEDNTWHDNYWGNCNCPRCKKIIGRNELGRLLEELRATL